MMVDRFITHVGGRSGICADTPAANIALATETTAAVFMIVLRTKIILTIGEESGRGLKPGGA